MGAGPHRPLTVAGESCLHRMAPECKLAATVLFVITIVCTPREAFWAFGVYALVIVGLAMVAALPLTVLARRLVLEVPFLAFALFLPLVGGAEGRWAAWNIVAKGTLGVAASSVLVATTDPRELLQGMERLRVPKLFVGIASFMMRYLEIVAGDLRAMRVARASRGYDPRWIWQARAIAQSAGTLFVRSYERGERVYLAMAARGYDGTLPVLTHDAVRPAWGVALLLPAFGCAVALAAWGLR